MQQIWRNQSNQPAKKHQPPGDYCQIADHAKILQAIEVIAATLATVLIQGQTGVGKELIARAIHAMSDRCNKPFILRLTAAQSRKPDRERAVRA